MKTHTATTGLAVLLFLSILHAQLPTVCAQGTAFTYQGRLTDSGGPANGHYDFIFSVFEAASGGNSLGGSVNANAILVSNGLFTVVLDFGSVPFSGPPRWLQISVSTNGAGSFATLAPRQEITRAPYATFANTAATVTNGAIASAQLAVNAVGSVNIQSNAVRSGQIASGQVVKSLNGLTDAVSITQGANVTINTVGNSLEISAPAGGLVLPFSGSASSGNSIFTLANSGTGPAGVFLGSVGIGTTSSASLLTVGSGSTRGTFNIVGSTTGIPVMSLTDSRAGGHQYSLYGGLSGAGNLDVFDQTAAASRFTINSVGNVGVGTESPQARLDVRGDVRLGPSGQFRATSGEENLRIVRGVVSGAGAVLDGSGFAVERLSTGRYQITFTSPFLSAPSITGAGHVVFVNEAPTLVSIASRSINRAILSVDLFTGENIDATFHFIAIGPR